MTWDGPVWDGQAYQERFDRLARSGASVHGEADLVAALGPRRVLDAGCGTGRVAIELARRGMAVVGVDRDESMLAVAREREPGVRWVTSGLAGLHLGERFDVVVMAGNVPLFTDPGGQRELVAGCARHLGPGGRLVAGFQTDQGYAIDAYDEDCRAAGLELEARWSTWDRGAWTPESGYAVSVHRRPVGAEEAGAGPPD